MFIYKLQRPHTSPGLYVVSVVKPPLDTAKFSSSHQLNGLWRQGKWFSSDRGCISLHCSSPFTIHPANGNKGIYQRKRHQQNNRNAAGMMMDSNWILFRNPRHERRRVEPCATRSWPSPKEKPEKLSLRTDGGVSGCINTPVFARKPHFR